MTIGPTTSGGNNFLSTLCFKFLMEGDDGIYSCNVTILDTTISGISDLTGLISKQSWDNLVTCNLSYIIFIDIEFHIIGFGPRC